MNKYNPKKIESKWQKIWAKSGIYETKDSAAGKKNFMLLTEFPYPSGNLHIGHWYAFAVPDILARYFRLRGKNLMYPMGFDAFGLPAENAAIKRGINPRKWTEQNIKYMTNQFATMGSSFDWSRRVSTIDPEYYQWTQWIFLKMLEKGLAYRAETAANWCPNCKTVLANEQVVDGLCERCGAAVGQKKLKQWMLKITNYADRLVDDMEGLDWPESTKLAQKNWIGRSVGAVIKFKIQKPKSKITIQNSKLNRDYFEVFTTRLDTIFGCTYCVVAPENDLLENLKDSIKNYPEVRKYVSKAKNKSDLQRTELQKEKTGVELKGVKAINPFTKEAVPIFVADYVLGHYGTGAVMAVPAHDERDFEFAKKYKLPVKIVITQNAKYEKKNSSANFKTEIFKKAFVEDGFLVNSNKYSGLTSERAREEMVKWLEKNKLGGRKKTYRLHDWVISRQRYWGVPIPVVYCPHCAKIRGSSTSTMEVEPPNYAIVPIPEKDLPVKLPDLKDFLPTGDGKSPLAKAEKWVNVKCPHCGGAAKRETDTMDTFVDSSWYFIRYADPNNKKKFADKAKMKKWLPIPLYIGGAEHNTMHLLYSRFFTKVLYDLNLVHFNEPFTSRRNHGTILGPDNQKMSKSRGNVVDPDGQVKKWGADSVRMYLAFMGPYDQNASWQMTGIAGVRRFLEKVWRLKSKIQNPNVKQNPKSKIQNKKLEILLHRTIKKITEDIENLRFNTAISALMILLNEFEKQKEIYLTHYTQYIILLSPFAPHIAEELWSQMGHKKSIFLEKWPKYNPKLIIEEEITIVVQVNGKVRDQIKIAAEAGEREVKNAALESEKIRKYIPNTNAVKKVIFVPMRLINFVI